MSNKRKRNDELDEYSNFPKKNINKELRLIKNDFKEIDGKYYHNGKLINKLIDDKDLDTLSINFILNDPDNRFIRQVSPKIKKMRLVRYNNPIDNFPDHITHLETGDLDHPINKLPKSLEYLYVEDNFTKTINDYPENLKFLRLSKNAVFNADRLPDNLVNLEIPKAVCVDNLPNSIVYLKIRSNVSVDNLPESVKYLSLGIDRFDNNSFNKPIDNLPFSIIKLELGNKFNQSINNLPNKLVELKIGNDFNHPIDNLPQTLRKLELGVKFNQPINNLPIGLIELILGYNFNQPVDNLPITLKKLVLGENFNQSINNLPTNLELLVLSKNFNQSIDNLNPNLKKIQLGENFNQPINTLPNSLESIIFTKYYILPLDNLPVKLKQIQMDIDIDRNDINYMLFDNKIPDFEPITIHYKSGLKKIDFVNLYCRLDNYKFKLKINEQTHLISMDYNYDKKSQNYILNYNDKNINIEIKSKSIAGVSRKGFSIEFN
jgi:hypothetical protein